MVRKNDKTEAVHIAELIKKGALFEDQVTCQLLNDSIKLNQEKVQNGDCGHSGDSNAG